MDKLIKENPARDGFHTPAGYLVHEAAPQVAKKNRRKINEGISVLFFRRKILPGVSVNTVRRQLLRWNDAEESEEREKFLARSERYKKYGDIKIYSLEGAGSYDNENR